MVDFVADGVTGDAEFYSDEDDDEEPPAPPPPPSRRPQATRLAARTQNPSPPDESHSPDSPEEVSHNTTRSTTASSRPRVPLTNGRRQSMRRVRAASQQAARQTSQQPSQQSQQPPPPLSFSPTETYTFVSARQEMRSTAQSTSQASPQHVSHHHRLSASGGSPRSPTDRFIVHDELMPPIHPPLTLTAADRAAHPNIYTEKSVFPLQDKQQAILLRHFVQNLAIWLDLCEPAQQFGTIVPKRAATCTVLLNAILALSSKHLAHIGNFDRYASDRYHQECLNVLIPMLSHEDTAADENLFAATIILRVWEEMEFKHSGFDSQGYLLGIHAFVHGHGHKIVPNTLSAAAFWVGLRQEIYTATINQQPVKAPLVLSLADSARGLSPAEDHDWANRAVIHCVDVLNFCFGETVSTLSPRFSWDELSSWNKQWSARLPDSFTPTYFKERGPGDAFPEIWHHSSWHVTGLQHHILAELFLVSFDPKIPRIGRQRLEAAKNVNDRVCALVREVCGIGLGNQWTPPGMFTACMAITAFGDRFHERRDQEALLDMLRRTEKDHARPTEAVQQQLMRSWGWDTSQMT
ncbi:ARCA-like protein [Sporothrix schenckii 1099-18]|uniref:ARCA-like protein n=1 Tax=Sporothrix schenckii 1099-18 TaxID=1397361 RepID=A0A0F2ML38_SPOSC|nr:ARCA-like protein [Sporothrix schenckii 1099-18]KJR89525.1 ARCA-like protein [Sporothrix schenckii 1099-18]